MVGSRKGMMMDDNISTLQSDLLEKTGMLVEALPFMPLSDQTLVVKFGTRWVKPTSVLSADIALLDQVGARPVVVHGGGPQIGAMPKKRADRSKFIDGLRVMTRPPFRWSRWCWQVASTARVAAIAQPVAALSAFGKDAGRLLRASWTATQDRGARYRNHRSRFVGEPDHVDTGVLDALNVAKLIPVSLLEATAMARPITSMPIRLPAQSPRRLARPAC